MTRIGSLFSGCGGLDQGVQDVIGGNIVWHCENDPAAAAVLAHRYPGIPNLGDITAVNWTAVESVDVLTGGFPCQDISGGGPRVGMRAGNRSGLWSAMVRAIGQLRPSLVVIENVRGLLSSGADTNSAMEPCLPCLEQAGDEPAVRALGVVLGDLADIGYDARWCGLRASDVGACHPRYRVFITARPAVQNTHRAAGHQRGQPAPGQTQSRWARTDTGRRGGAPAAHTMGAHNNTSDWGVYGPAIHRWETACGRPAPEPATPRFHGGQSRLSPAFVEWMMGLPAGWVTNVPGITVNQQLKMLGGGVVPQQATAALNWLLNLEN